MRISRLTVLSVIAPLTLVLIGLIVVLIAFTPIREFIPGYPNESTRRQITHNALKADSLERVIASWDRYFNNINNILNGKDADPIQSAPPDTALGRKSRTSLLVSKDSVFRAQVEKEEQFNLAVNAPKKNQFENLFFYPPLKGSVVTPFSTASNHFGIDIATEPNTAITSTLDGTVISTYWTLDDGYTIMVQHTDNLISVYKQAARLLKKVGEHVASGEAIAFVGLPTGKTEQAELHFELWHNGSPINPTIYITL